MVGTAHPAQPRGVSRFAAIWHGHVFVFDRPVAAPSYPDTIGWRLLGLAVAVDTLRRALNFVGSPWIPLWVRAALCLLLAFVGLQALGLSARAIGLRPWREWNATERSYFIQVLILANMLFPMMFSAELSRAFAESSALAVAAGFIGYVFLGFLQELVYRGILQMEFTRRWRALAGILVSNLLYTFVQHSSYFGTAASLALPMFAGIFAMGLVFAMVFWRSGNLWTVGVMHALGNAYIATAVGGRS